MALTRFKAIRSPLLVPIERPYATSC